MAIVEILIFARNNIDIMVKLEMMRGVKCFSTRMREYIITGMMIRELNLNKNPLGVERGISFFFLSRIWAK